MKMSTDGHAYPQLDVRNIMCLARTIACVMRMAFRSLLWQYDAKLIQQSPWRWQVPKCSFYMGHMHLCEMGQLYLCEIGRL